MISANPTNTTAAPSRTPQSARHESTLTKNADGSTRIDLNLSGQKVFIALADPAKVPLVHLGTGKCMIKDFN